MELFTTENGTMQDFVRAAPQGRVSPLQQLFQADGVSNTVLLIEGRTLDSNNEIECNPCTAHIYI
jgi:hypothetical protein